MVTALELSCQRVKIGLTWVDVSGLKLKEIPFESDKLEYLDCSENELKVLPQYPNLQD